MWKKISKKRSARSNVYARRASQKLMSFEKLERRLCLTAPFYNGDGFLQVNGTEGNDVITVETAGLEPGQVGPQTTKVTVNGNDFGGWSYLSYHIEVRSLGGNDTITILGTIKETKLYGGDGNDTINGAEYVSPYFPGNDFVNAGNNNDTIYGYGGDDTIYGGSGVDTIYGGDGDDLVHGGGGNDTLEGENGIDIMYGANGDDTMRGGNGNDRVIGHDGDDQMYGQDNNDYMNGGPGDDMLSGGGHNDSVYGGDGNDELFGADGNDLLHGGNHDDVLYGEGGIDKLYGTNGNDQLFGGAANDRLVGGSGTDSLSGGSGADVLLGQAGSDRFLEQNETVESSRDFAAGTDVTVFFNDGTANGSNTAGQWTEGEIQQVDEALADLHQISRNLVIDTLLLEGDEELRFTRNGNNGGASSASTTITTNDMRFFDLAFDGSGGIFDAEAWLRQTVYHEVGHHYDGEFAFEQYSTAENPTFADFYAIDWDFATSPATILPGARFARDYGSSHPVEDFGTAFAANLMDRAGLAYQGFGYLGQATGAGNIPLKMAYMDNFFATV